ncbi:hypothetical protein SBADM41S_05424 [Streptomyces badius]
MLVARAPHRDVAPTAEAMLTLTTGVAGKAVGNVTVCVQDTWDVKDTVAVPICVSGANATHDVPLYR